MFPAYTNVKKTETAGNVAGLTCKSDTDESNDQGPDWLENQSFAFGQKTTEEILLSSTDDTDTESVQIIQSEQVGTIEISSDDKTIRLTSDSDDATTMKAKRKKRKKQKAKKSKRKKKRKTKRNESESSESRQAPITDSSKPIICQSVLFDAEYNNIFNKIPKEKLVKAVFFEDIPGLIAKHAFRIDKRADLNNLCFDTLYHKHVSNYRVPMQSGEVNPDKMKKKRREVIREIKKDRYFNRMRKFATANNSLDELPSGERFAKSDLRTNASESLIMFKNLIDTVHQGAAFINKTASLNKSLNENPKDVNKWIEFINYQNVLEQEANQSSSYDRKLSLYERALKENPSSFKLKFELLKFKSRYDDAAMGQNETTTTTMKTTAEQATETEFQSLINEQLDVFNNAKQFDSQNDSLANLFHLWSEYVKYFSYTNTMSKNLNRIRSLYKKGFEFFLVKLNANESRIKASVFAYVLDFLFKGYLDILHRADFDEKVIGTYQALIDFNLTPKSSSSFALSTDGDANSLFELFYDSCLPKYGERFYVGYLNELERRNELYDLLEKNISIRDSCDSIELVILNKDDSRVEHKWLAIEHMRSVYHWYPFYVQIQAGESADDDCEDEDRLIKFDEDISDILVINIDKNFQDDRYKNHFKAKLLCQYYEYFNIISIFDNNDYDQVQSYDDAYLLPNKLNMNLDPNDLNGNWFHKFLTVNQSPAHLNHFISLMRNSFGQNTDVYKTNDQLKILRWKFELNLYYYAALQNPFQADENLRPTILKEVLLNQMKRDLSEHRTNTNMWLNYAVIKYLLSKHEATESSSISYQKELRKIIDNLLVLNSNDYLHKLDICLIFIELSLSLYRRTYDVIFDKNLSIDVGIPTGLFEDHIIKAPVKLDSLVNKQATIDLLVDVGLNSQQTSASNTIKINLTSSTRVLLRRKELQNKYDAYIHELSKTNDESKLNEILKFHKVYTYYLLLNQNFDLLFEISRNMFNLLKEKADDMFCSFCEFYLNLNYFIYFECNRFSKSEFKKKLFQIVNYLFENESLLKKSAQLNNSLQVILMKYKLNTKSIVDINYLNIIIKNYSKLDISKKFIQSLGLLNLNVDYYRLKEINKLLINQTTVHTLGLHNQLKNDLNYFLNLLPFSVDLWLFYFKLESESRDKNRIIYIYYQSIRNLPFVKDLYLKAIEYLPEKFNEIMQQIKSKEIRTRLPTEELEILLEPMKSKMQLEDENDNAYSTTFVHPESPGEPHKSRSDEENMSVDDDEDDDGKAFNFDDSDD